MIFHFKEINEGFISLEGGFKVKIEETKQTLTNGNLRIKNVPHLYKRNGTFPDGEKAALSGEVMYKLAKIFRHMLNNNILEFDFDNFQETSQ